MERAVRGSLQPTPNSDHLTTQPHGTRAQEHKRTRNIIGSKAGSTIIGSKAGSTIMPTIPKLRPHPGDPATPTRPVDRG